MVSSAGILCDVLPPAALTSLHVAEAHDIDAIFRRYAPYVGAIALRLMGRRDDVEDIVQEVFLQAVVRLDSLRDPEALKGWLATVTVRAVRQKLRRRRLFDSILFRTKRSYLGVSSSNSDPEQAALLTRVYEVLDDLPVDLRIPWVLRTIEGERLDTVARLCNCSLATAKRRIAAAHEALTKAIDHG